MQNEFIDVPSHDLPYLTKQETKFMDLLIEYLLEYQKRHQPPYNLDPKLNWFTVMWVHETIIISDKFWFIRHLVGNGNIDREKLQDILNIQCYDFPIWKSYDKMGSEYMENYTRYESLIMLLSIQHNPIEFLTHIIK